MSYISIEANIGVGKSTLVPLLAKELDMVHVVEDLSSEGAFLTALGNYNENADLALELQLAINDYRVGVAKNTVMGLHVVERSMMSDMVFAQVMNQRGDISNGDLRLFEAVSMAKLSLFSPEVCVYLACDPIISFERMQMRGREEESNNTLEYLTQLEDAHMDILPQLCDKLNIPLLIVGYTDFGDPVEIAHAINAIRRTLTC